MRREQRLNPGEAVAASIALSPMAMLFHAGEELELTISGFRFPPFIPFDFGKAKVPFPVDGLTFQPGHPTEIRDFYGPGEASAKRLTPPVPPTRNKGRHIIHFGGLYDSHLSISQLPPA